MTDLTKTTGTGKGIPSPMLDVLRSVHCALIYHVSDSYSYPTLLEEGDGSGAGGTFKKETWSFACYGTISGGGKGNGYDDGVGYGQESGDGHGDGINEGYGDGEGDSFSGD